MDESPALHKPYLAAFGSFDLEVIVHVGRTVRTDIATVRTARHTAINDRIRII